MDEATRAAQSQYRVQKTTLKDQDADEEILEMTPAERIGMVRQLTINAWAFMGVDIGRSRMRRDVVRMYRRRRKPRQSP